MWGGMRYEVNVRRKREVVGARELLAVADCKVIRIGRKSHWKLK